MPRRTEPFVAGNYYHLYNRGNNGEQTFFLPEDYQHFIAVRSASSLSWTSWHIV